MLPHELDSASPSSRRVISRHADPAQLARAAAELTSQLLREAVGKHGVARIALAGGSTPKALYRLFADDDGLRASVPWKETHFFFGDERHVPPDHADSNFKMASEALFNRIPAGLLPPENLHRIESENPSAYLAAAAYAEKLNAHFQGALPEFDVILLGMGPDGHTASIFPGTTALRENAQTVCAVWVDKFSTYRVTMTPPVLCNARRILFLVAGADKTKTLKSVLEGGPETDRYPSQGIVSHRGETSWMLDEAAAAELVK